MLTITLEVSSATFDDENKIISGWSDVRLSQLGMDQSKQLTARYSGQIDAVFSSDLRRAKQTVDIAFDGSAKNVYTDWRLRECDYGEMAQSPLTEFDGAKALYIDQPFPGGGESYQQCTERIRSFLFDMKTHFDGKKILIISHPSTQYALEALVNNKPLTQSIAEAWEWQPGWTYQIQ